MDVKDGLRRAKALPDFRVKKCVLYPRDNNYELPNFSHEKVAFFWEIKKRFKAPPSVVLQKIL